MSTFYVNYLGLTSTNQKLNTKKIINGSSEIYK